MSKFILTIVLSIFVAFTVSCSVHPGEKGYLEIQQIIYKGGNYKAENESAGLEKFQSYSTNEQLDIYLFARCCTEGGSLLIAKYLDVNFEKKIPLIAERIKMSEKGRDKIELLGLFTYQNSECLKSHPEIVKILSDAQPQISESDSEDTKWEKRMYIKILSDLKDCFKKPPFRDKRKVSQKCVISNVFETLYLLENA